jgi:deoxyribose-phosphate aldolase
MTPDALARMIDHTLLKPDATAADIERLCAEAKRHGFFSVCVNPAHVARCKALLRGSRVKLCTVAGFPLGAQLPETKAFEARHAVRDGADEVDMVINIGALKDRDDALVERDIRGVVEACREGGALTKVILETALLTDDEKARACDLSMKAGADYVKTSTGFAKGGATAEDIELMAKTVAPKRLGVKASGGIRTCDDALTMIAAGATRIGASASVAIIEEANARASEMRQRQSGRG